MNLLPPAVAPPRPLPIRLRRRSRPCMARPGARIRGARAGCCGGWGSRYRYRDVDEDLEALDRATTLNQGVRRTPVVTIGSDVFVEPTNSAMTAALLAHGLLTREQVAERLHLQNVGDFERVIRVSSGLLVLASQRQAPRVLRGLLTLTGAGLVLTGVFGWCPVFHAKGVSSLNGPGDRPDEAERQSWLRPGRRDRTRPRARNPMTPQSQPPQTPQPPQPRSPPRSRRPTAPSS